MRVFWSKDSIYCTYYEAFLPENTENQNTTDRAAVLKFIRRRERQKLADENKAGLALTKDSLEQVSPFFLFKRKFILSANLLFIQEKLRNTERDGQC